MKFLVDAQLPPGLCGWLRDRGHIAVHVHDLADEPLTDVRLAAFVEEEQAVLMSKDEDFVTLRLPDRFVFLWLRCGNVSNRGLREWLGGHWLSVERRLEAGARFITLR
jgi:predicted nuclease of predicted toxin-antitoxin system